MKALNEQEKYSLQKYPLHQKNKKGSYLNRL